MRGVRGGDVAMIFQEPMTSLNPVLSVGRQLTEAIRAHRDVGAAAARAAALEALAAVRISEPERRLKQYPHELSGGMRQRVMIAMALAGRPEGADRRRADDRARRHRAGADPRADPQPAAASSAPPSS